MILRSSHESDSQNVTHPGAEVHDLRFLGQATTGWRGVAPDCFVTVVDGSRSFSCGTNQIHFFFKRAQGPRDSAAENLR